MVGEAEIQAQLRRILRSPTFAASARSREFLEFCVDHAVHRDCSQLKETTIAVAVFLRPADYDPKADPIVRVHARRVREKLDEYYRDFGIDDPITIAIPKGGYVPQILRALPRRKTDFSDWAVDEITESRVTIDPPSLTVRQEGNRSSLPRRRLTIVTLATMVVLLLTAIVWIARVPRGKSRGTSTDLGPFMPVDLGADRASEFAWSPDGHQLAFTLTTKNGTAIYTQDFASHGPPMPLTDGAHPDQAHPVWSPDGTEIAFTQKIDASYTQVVRYRLATKQQQNITRLLNPYNLFPDFFSIDWSPDGRSLVASEGSSTTSPVRLILISVATGERTILTSPPSSSTGDTEARFSPDGKLVAFHRGGLGDLYIVSIQGEQHQPAVALTHDNPGIRGIAWMDHGKSILYATGHGGDDFGLAKIARTGGTPEALGPSHFDVVAPAVSSNGTVAVEHRELTSNLVAHAVKDGSGTILLSGDSPGSEPTYSPDGQLIAYLGNRSGCKELWLFRQADQSSSQLTHLDCHGKILFPSWSPDGQTIAFSYRERGATNLFLYSLIARSLKELTHTTRRDISPVFSADGKNLFYSSNDDGTSRIWRMHADGSGNAEPLFIEGVTGFLPSPDGKWLYFLGGDNRSSLLRRSLVDDTTEEVFHLTGRPAFYNSIALGGGHIFIAESQQTSSDTNILEVDPATKSARPVLHLSDLLPPSLVPGFSVTRDGNRLVTEHIKGFNSLLYTAKLNP